MMPIMIGMMIMSPREEIGMYSQPNGTTGSRKESCPLVPFVPQHEQVEEEYGEKIDRNDDRPRLCDDKLDERLSTF